MVKRHARSSFGAAYAFPGGVLEVADSNIHDRCAGVSATDANELLGLQSGGLDYYSAAVRELFEETGVLLGAATLGPADLAECRDRLNDGSLDWVTFATGCELQLDCAALHYFSFWITPTELPKRYSTRFFLAQLPDGMEATHCGGELTDSCWMSASDILAAWDAQKMTVHYPTRKTLERIAQFESSRALLDWADRRAERGVDCILPTLGPEMLR